MAQDKLSTFSEFLDSVYFQKKEHCEDEINHFLKLLNHLPETAFPDNSYFVLDYIKRKYILIKGNIEQITGNSCMDFIEGGTEFLQHIYHKDDFAIFDKNIFKNSMRILGDLSYSEINNYVFSFNFRLRARNGQYNTILQKCKYIKSKQSKLPLFCYGMASNITPYKKDKSIVLVIDKMVRTGHTSKIENVSTNNFFPVPEESQLTNREKEILFWTIEGLSIKQLAGKLSLSDFTVGNHRANILRKTNSKNVAQLVKFAIENGYV